MRSIQKLGGTVRSAMVCSVVFALSIPALGCGSDEATDDGGPKVPFTPGDPIEVDSMTWTYVNFPGAKCRNGSETGIGININPASDKLIFYFEGGGACFNDLTCATNPAGPWNQANLGTPRGVLDRDNADNPFKDWNLIYVPYCTGDVFSGTKTTGGYNGAPQQGYINVGEYLARVVPTFPDVDQVILSGSSAGGFGVAWNWLRTQDAFGDIPVYVLDDSGPAFGPDYFAPCLAQRMTEMWGWADSLHPACTDCDLETGMIVQPLLETAVAALGDQRFALLSNSEDSTIKQFFGFGQNDCAQLDAFALPTYPTGKFPMGLAELRDASADLPNVKMWVVTGTSHTFLSNIYSPVSEGVNLKDWIVDFYTDEPTWDNVFPAL